MKTIDPLELKKINDEKQQRRLDEEAAADAIRERLPHRVAFRKREQLEKAAPDLLAVCKATLEHISELQEAWRTGAITERDDLGGTRSNRNVDVRVNLEAAIAKAETP
jgi:hypothetical protein